MKAQQARDPRERISGMWHPGILSPQMPQGGQTPRPCALPALPDPRCHPAQPRLWHSPGSGAAAGVPGTAAFVCSPGAGQPGTKGV